MIFDQPPSAITTPELPNRTRLVPFERHLSAIRWQFVRGVLIGILVSSAVAIPAFKYSSIRQHRASSHKTSGQTAVGSSEPQTASPQRMSTSDVAGTSSPTPILLKSQPSKLGNAPPGKPVEPPVAKQLSKSPVPVPVNQPAPLRVPSIPEPKPTPKTVTSTPEELWSSVRAGDTRAAVALADLYLHGDGVSQNCDQARVLLAAASKENNAEAIRKLQDLDQNGCPAP